MRMTPSLRQAFVVLAGFLSLPSPDVPLWAQSATDSAAVAAVVESFHQSLAEGDSATALLLLGDDVVIMESGGIESRQAYRSHHLPADIAFARAVKATLSPVRVAVRGDLAWTAATSRVRGSYRGKAINAEGAELMVLARTGQGWKIRAVHWSSRDGS